MNKIGKDKPYYPFPEDWKCPICGGQLETVLATGIIKEALKMGEDDVIIMPKFVCSKEGHVFIRGEKTGSMYLIN